MARRRGRAKAGAPLLEKGVLALFLGGALLAAPLILGSSRMLRPVVDGLKVPAWIAISVGGVLLATHLFIVWMKARSSRPSPREQPHAKPRANDLLAPAVPPDSGERRRPEVPTAVSTQADAFSAPPTRQDAWNQQVFRTIEWRRFEAVCERLFAQGGFEARSQSHGADGGVDIWLYSRHVEGPAAVVQCKHWLGKPVGVKEMREFFGVMTAQAVKRGTFATSSSFTPAATEFARDNGISVLDGERLLALIGRRSPPQQQELLAIAYEGDYWRPTCASCGVKMTGRTAAKDDRRFWGCVNFPKCRTTMPVRTA